MEEKNKFGCQMSWHSTCFSASAEAKTVPSQARAHATPARWGALPVALASCVAGRHLRSVWHATC